MSSVRQVYLVLGLRAALLGEGGDPEMPSRPLAAEAQRHDAQHPDQETVQEKHVDRVDCLGCWKSVVVVVVVPVVDLGLAQFAPRTRAMVML